ncbi:MAG: hypothetical protein P4L67_04960 [Candidatus Pacebacteria bacterium]|nr:hypothetical protein [Candidatus Paceibacterota bacterium]
MINDDADVCEDYCSDCGCAADDEVCPRCMAEVVDVRRRYGIFQGDRRWNGESMSRNRDRLADTSVLMDVRETPLGTSRRSSTRPKI